MEKMGRLVTYVMVGLGFWLVSAVALIAQFAIWLLHGAWMPGRLGDVILGLGFAEPTQWLGEGSVYRWLWAQPLSVLCFGAGLIVIEYTIATTIQMRLQRA
jgi:hypothetical protein